MMTERPAGRRSVPARNEKGPAHDREALRLCVRRVPPAGGGCQAVAALRRRLAPNSAAIADNSSQTAPGSGTWLTST